MAYAAASWNVVGRKNDDDRHHQYSLPVRETIAGRYSKCLYTVYHPFKVLSQMKHSVRYENRFVIIFPMALCVIKDYDLVFR